MLAHLEAHADFYEIGQTPLVDIFGELRDALSKEILVEEEQENLRRAGEYYRGRTDVLVPAIYPFSTPSVTCMELVRGRKITDAFPDDPEARAELGRRLSDLMTYDVIFSRREEAVFHGDPHAGNVFHVEGADDPYRIALIDWGLMGTFTREQRESIVQLLVGLQLGNAKRLARHMEVLVHWNAENAPSEEQRRAIVKELLDGRGERQSFELLNDLIAKLAARGYPVRFETLLFIKSQLTIYGILRELDPELAQDKHLMGRISGQVRSEYRRVARGRRGRSSAREGRRKEARSRL